MIYGNLILENSLNEMTNPINIMEEYYKNEISFLNSVIEYRGIVSESCDLKILHEGFIEATKNKIKELIDKFIKWLKDLWNKFTQLFKKKLNNEANNVKKAKTAIDLIEHNPNLSEEQKNEKIDNILYGFTKSNKEETNNTDSKKDKENNSKKYKMYFIESYYIANQIFNTMHNVDIKSIINPFFENDQYINNQIERINDQLNNVKLKSLDDIWNNYTQGYCIELGSTDPKEILKIYDDNLKKYEDFKKYIEKIKNDIDRNINQLKRTINNLPADMRKENLTLYTSVVNKYISLTKQEISLSTQFIVKLGSNLKPILC